jgi:CxxC motif-containing protein (DUF1111 family)
MNCCKPAWYGIALLVVLGPVGLRVLTRPDPPRHDLEPAEVRQGQMLFAHEFTAKDPLCPKGDGLGPVFNASSCVACHHQGGAGGSGANKQNVTTFVVRGTNRQGVVHTEATASGFQETLGDVDPSLRREKLSPDIIGEMIRGRRLVLAAVDLSQRNTPALFGTKLIDEIPDRAIISEERGQWLRWGMAADTDERPVGRVLRLPGNRVGKFGWKAQSATLFDFVQAACANELGLGNPGQAQPASMKQPGYQAPGFDLSNEQCRQITTFVAALHRPVERVPANPDAQAAAHEGKQLFMKIGCADCHTPNVGSVEGIYSDLLLHRMGNDLSGTNSYYGQPVISVASSELPRADEWRTPPLWGVADSAPYLHDGRATKLEDAITMHGGQAKTAAVNFQRLSQAQQERIVAFLKTLRAQ